MSYNYDTYKKNIDKKKDPINNMDFTTRIILKDRAKRNYENQKSIYDSKKKYYDDCNKYLNKLEEKKQRIKEYIVALDNTNENMTSKIIKEVQKLKESKLEPINFSDYDCYTKLCDNFYNQYNTVRKRFNSIKHDCKIAIDGIDDVISDLNTRTIPNASSELRTAKQNMDTAWNNYYQYKYIKLK